MAADNFARGLKTLGGLTPYEDICKIRASEPYRVILDPIRQMPGLNIEGGNPTCGWPVRSRMDAADLFGGPWDRASRGRRETCAARSASNEGCARPRSARPCEPAPRGERLNPLPCHDRDWILDAPSPGFPAARSCIVRRCRGPVPSFRHREGRSPMERDLGRDLADYLLASAGSADWRQGLGRLRRPARDVSTGRPEPPTARRFPRHLSCAGHGRRDGWAHARGATVPGPGARVRSGTRRGTASTPPFPHCAGPARKAGRSAFAVSGPAPPRDRHETPLPKCPACRTDIVEPQGPAGIRPAPREAPALDGTVCVDRRPANERPGAR